MDVSQFLSDAANTVAAAEGAGAAISAGKKIREKFKKKNNPLLDRYYNDIMDDLDKDEKSVLTGDGALSNNEVYIDAYSVEYPETKILNTIDRWSSKDDYGVMLIHGEPGHGKTTLCRKAVYEYGMDRFCKDKTNVFWFRLNPAFAEDIIEESGKFVLKNAFCWGDPEIELNRIPLEDNKKEYQNSVVFLDGYDELQAQLHDVNKNLKDFITTAKKIAQTYDMHIVITTRTRSLSDEGRLNIPSLQFAPISRKEQDAWIKKNAPSYKEDFEVLRASSEEMKEMLGIPILFRMVVKAKLKSTIAKNVVDLYDTLFEATMERRAADSAEISYWRGKYEQFAYEIYCNDEQFADIEDEQRADEFLYMFYIKGEGKQHVEFLHRSFYQYFLAHFLYRKMSEVEDEASAEAFLCCLAERRIDRDVLNYIQQIQEKKPDVTQEKCEQIINTLEQTGTIIIQALEIPKKNGDAEKHSLMRCENVLINALSICCVVATTKGSEFIISLHEKENIHTAMRRYNCSGIWLNNVDLSGANLINADLSITNLNGANLTGTKLIGADLEEAGLTGTDLIGTNLDGADLRDADLSRADLRKADLTGADLSRADLRWAKNLDNTCNYTLVEYWGGCKILLKDKDNLVFNNPDARGIIWCDNDTGEPIESRSHNNETAKPIKSLDENIIIGWIGNPLGL